MPNIAIIDANVYQDDRHTASRSYPLPTQINVETTSQSGCLNTDLPLSGDLGPESKEVGPEGFEPPID
jgi:hypothetical protein